MKSVCLSPRLVHHTPNHQVIQLKPICRARRPILATSASLSSTTNSPSKSPLTRKIFEQLERNGTSLGQQAQGAGGGTTYVDLQRIDAAWLDLRTKLIYRPPPTFVTETGDSIKSGGSLDYDIVVAGGTLGIFLACALQLSGLKVAVLERGPLLGRTQEWNISRKELYELVELGILTKEQAEECISIEFNPVRVGFHGSKDIWTKDVLNLGVSPAKLIQRARATFEAHGGTVLERTALNSVRVHPNGTSLNLYNTQNQTSTTVTAQLIIDAMGNQSPIVRQIRFGRKPDGVCLVVGSCARGFDAAKNTTGDVIYTAGPSEGPSSSTGHLQLYWEAFPAGSDPTDRTTYMFTYLDAAVGRPSLEDLMELYWSRMPEYQNVALEDLEVLRILFGLFPTYRDSPLPPAFDRILQVGDAGGLQSPLSFGGFAALSRHLHRLRNGITDAVQCKSLDKYSLGLINAYSPALSGAWMMQRAMSIPTDLKKYDVNFINKLLGGNFQVMETLGDATLKPFLQDVIQVGPLTKTLTQQMAKDPLFVPQIFMRVGFGPLADWLVHYLGLLVFTGLSKVGGKYEDKVERLPAKQRFMFRRALENWKYGAGLDYKD